MIGAYFRDDTKEQSDKDHWTEEHYMEEIVAFWIGQPVEVLKVVNTNIKKTHKGGRPGYSTTTVVRIMSWQIG